MREILTHVPWVEGKERGHDVESVGGTQGEDDVAEDLVRKQLVGLDRSIFRNILNTPHSKIDWSEHNPSASTHWLQRACR